MMRNSGTLIKWILFGIVVAFLVGVNDYLWGTFSSVRSENQLANKQLRSLQTRLEKHHQRKEQLTSFRAEQSVLLRELHQIVFACDREGIDISVDWKQSPNQIFCFENNSGDSSRIRFWLPENMKAKVATLVIDGIPSDKLVFSIQPNRIRDQDFIETTIRGAGWHSIERKLEKDGGVNEVSLKVDDQVVASVATPAGSRTSGNMPKILEIDKQKLNAGECDYPLHSGWCISFGAKQSEKRAFGFVVDQLKVSAE